MPVVEFPVSGLTERDYEALERVVAGRFARGIAGTVTRGVTAKGQMWAAIVERPGGAPLQHFCRDQGVYYVLDFTGPAGGRLVDAGRRFEDLLEKLPSRTN